MKTIFFNYQIRTPVAHLVFSLVLAGLLIRPLAAREKVDVLVMKNGDRITCEIRNLDRGQLNIKTSYTVGTILVDWKKVERVESKQLFRVDVSDGQRHSGALEEKEDEEAGKDRLRIVSDASATTVEHSEVVAIQQLGTSFWRQLDGKVDLGFSRTLNNNQTQSNVNAEVQRFTRKHLTRFSLSSVLSRQSEGEDTNRHNGTAQYAHTFKKKWFVGGVADFLVSDEQDLNLRTTVGGLAGRRLVWTNRTIVSANSGIVLNNERYSEGTSETPVRTNAEVLIGADVSLFRFDSTEFTAGVKFYPSITQSGRYRVDFTTDLFLDLWGDLYFRLSFYNNYDSSPPEGLSGKDLGVTTSVGWSF